MNIPPVSASCTPWGLASLLVLWPALAAAATPPDATLPGALCMADAVVVGIAQDVKVTVRSETGDCARWKNTPWTVQACTTASMRVKVTQVLSRKSPPTARPLLVEFTRSLIPLDRLKALEGQEGLYLLSRSPAGQGTEPTYLTPASFSLGVPMSELTNVRQLLKACP